MFIIKLSLFKSVSVLNESLALRAMRMFAKGSTYKDIGKELEISTSSVGKLIREAMRAQYLEDKHIPEISHHVPNSPKPVSKKKADSPRKKAYELFEERPRKSTLARTRVVVTMEFDDLRRLCHYQKWDRCWETRRRCDIDFCPYIWK